MAQSIGLRMVLTARYLRMYRYLLAPPTAAGSAISAIDRTLDKYDHEIRNRAC